MSKKIFFLRISKTAILVFDIAHKSSRIIPITFSTKSKLGKLQYGAFRMKFDVFFIFGYCRPMLLTIEHFGPFFHDFIIKNLLVVQKMF